MIGLLSQLWNDESGQGLSEYAMLISGVVVTVVAAGLVFRGSIEDLFVAVGGYMASNSPPA